MSVKLMGAWVAAGLLGGEVAFADDGPAATVSAAPPACVNTTVVCPPAIPSTVSAEAQHALANAPKPLPATANLAQRRQFFTDYQQAFAKVQMRKYAVTVENGVIHGVPVKTFKPVAAAGSRADRVLMDLHGGAFQFDSGSLTENVPIAALSHTTVIAVLYRLAPEHAFPAAVDDAVSVYKELLQTHSPKHIGLYGTSAGAILTAETVFRLRQLRLPLPAVLGFFSGSADLSQAGDSEFYFPVADDRRPLPAIVLPYVGSHDPKDPAISPLYGNLQHLPPTLCVTSTRDLLLSQTVLFHRALLRAGVNASLVVFEALPHAFWAYLDTPESDEAFGIMANFLSAGLDDRM